jgi:hypothetical protein
MDHDGVHDKWLHALSGGVEVSMPEPPKQDDNNNNKSNIRKET